MGWWGRSDIGRKEERDGEVGLYREGGREGETDHNSCPSSMSCMSVKLCPTNAWPAYGYAISSCQVLGRAGSARHGADQHLLRGLPDATVTSFLFI